MLYYYLLNGEFFSCNRFVLNSKLSNELLLENFTQIMDKVWGFINRSPSTVTIKYTLRQGLGHVPLNSTKLGGIE